ncbi:hypothetical protein [Natronorubrum sp. FCH18a]|uniref:hypothetical protein n=1 Tax=Natronorubrum sp. FCH18a TaxID=3447018 RepID=UPI003F5163F5
MGKLSLGDIYHGSNEQASALQELLYAIVLTPILLLPPSAREIVSVEAIAVAVGTGVISGVTVTLLLEGAQIGSNRSDGTMTIVALASIAVGTALVWLVFPREHLSTFTQFSVVFMWSVALTSVARHIVRPAVVGSANARD